MEKPFSTLRQLDHHGEEPIRLYPNCESDDYPQHWHTTFEIIMPIQNDYTVFVGDEDHILYPGDIIVIPSGVVHELFAPATGMRYIFMVDQGEALSVEGVAAVLNAFYPCVHMTPGDELYAHVAPLLSQTAAELTAADYFSSAMVRALMGAFFAHIGRDLLKRQGGVMEGSTPHQHQLVAMYLDVCSYIVEHCHEKLTLDGMANYIGYSKYHFARMFKRFSGMSFYDYFMEQRIMRCERLLTDPSLSITEAAMRSGFGSIATFNRIFRDKKGVTPTQYREMLKQNSRWCENRNI